MRGADPWPRLTLARLILRDGRACWHCGTDEALTVQHRAVKGMGGRNSAERPSNGLALCGGMNVAIEQDAALAAWAEACGWKLRTTDDPSERPAWDAVAQRWVSLGDDWSRTLL